MSLPPPFFPEFSQVHRPNGKVLPVKAGVLGAAQLLGLERSSKPAVTVVISEAENVDGFRHRTYYMYSNYYRYIY